MLFSSAHSFCAFLSLKFLLFWYIWKYTVCRCLCEGQLICTASMMLHPWKKQRWAKMHFWILPSSFIECKSLRFFIAYRMSLHSNLLMNLWHFSVIKILVFSKRNYIPTPAGFIFEWILVSFRLQEIVLGSYCLIRGQVERLAFFVFGTGLGQ